MYARWLDEHAFERSLAILKKLSNIPHKQLKIKPQRIIFTVNFEFSDKVVPVSLFVLGKLATEYSSGINAVYIFVSPVV